MALLLHMPDSFNVGDTADVHINGKPERVTWTEGFLTILPDDKRKILSCRPVDGGLRAFTCSSSAEWEDVKTIDSESMAYDMTDDEIRSGVRAMFRGALLVALREQAEILMPNSDNPVEQLETLRAAMLVVVKTEVSPEAISDDLLAEHIRDFTQPLVALFR
jgi:hypothetical protein